MTAVLIYVPVSFVPAATEAPVPEPSPSGRLLDLARKLTDYGRELAATIRQRTATDPLFATIRFGTTDLVVILARIFRGLHRAEQLEARVRRYAAHLDAAPASAAPRAVDVGPDTTPAQIAAEARRRPIGAVIADISRDLGILPSHPLWRDVQQAMIKHGGNLGRRLMDIINRPGVPAVRPPTTIPPDPLRRPTLRSEAPGGTGRSGSRGLSNPRPAC